jgi:hypothetical protein
MSLTCNSVLPGGACVMGKAFKSGLCPYRGVAGSTTADHVIARGFFPLDLRANLPKVGACQECNHKKSKLEHALTAVMPFGAQHGRAKEALLPGERQGLRALAAGDREDPHALGLAGPGAAPRAYPWPGAASSLTLPNRDRSDDLATGVAGVGCVRVFAGPMEAAK